MGSDARRPILVVGSTGQIGHELLSAFSGVADIEAPTREELDLTRPSSIRETIRRVRPSVVVNAAAYTAVDRAESERELCFAVNAEAPRVLAEEARASGALMVQYSTDYVFDGTTTTPYVETDPPAPINVYGESKLAGERAVEDVGGRYIVLRTSWVYGARGTNFVRTILRLARERRELKVVADQTGAPTSSRTVAATTAQVVSTLLGNENSSRRPELSGVYHVTASGATTWYEFARAVLAGDPRAEEQVCERLVPITTAEFPTAARRPPYSVLDCSKADARFGLQRSDWREDLAAVLGELQRQ